MTTTMIITFILISLLIGFFIGFCTGYIKLALKLHKAWSLMIDEGLKRIADVYENGDIFKVMSKLKM